MAQTAIYYSVCGSGMSRAVVFYSHLVLTSYMGTYNFRLPSQGSWVFSRGCFPLFLTKDVLCLMN